MIWADAEAELSDDERRTDFSFSPTHSHALYLLFIQSEHLIQWQSGGILAVLVVVMIKRFIAVGKTAGKYVRDRLKLVAK